MRFRRLQRQISIRLQIPLRTTFISLEIPLFSSFVLQEKGEEENFFPNSLQEVFARREKLFPGSTFLPSVVLKNFRLIPLNQTRCLQERLVHSMSRDDIEKAANPEEQCVVCCQARAVMQVAPCGHQSQCRLCFVHNIQEAVASRQLPLRCLLCNAKIMRVKNNSAGNEQGKSMPKSVSGYSLQNNNGIAHSTSNYSMSSGKYR